MICAQGIVGMGAITHMSTVRSRLAGCRLITSTGSIRATLSSCRLSFPRRFVAGLKRAFERGETGFPNHWPRKSFSVVPATALPSGLGGYAKCPFGGPEYVLQDLARYPLARRSSERFEEVLGGADTDDP
jgi:hypothetical protein